MKPSTYIKTLWGSISSPQFYIFVLNKKLFFSIRFFIISYILIGLIISGIIVTVDFPEYKRMTQQVRDELIEQYPNDLLLTWDNQTLSTSSNNPVLVDYPSIIDKKDRIYKKLAIIDPSLPINQNDDFSTVSDHVATSSAIVVTDSMLLVRSAKNWNSFFLQELPGFETPFSLSKENLPQISQQIVSLIQSALDVIKYLVPIFFPLLLLVSRVINILIDAILAYLVFRLWNKNLSYWKILQVGLHVAIPAEIIAQTTGYVYGPQEIPMFALTFWILFIWLGFAFRKVGKFKLIKKS